MDKLKLFMMLLEHDQIDNLIRTELDCKQNVLNVKVVVKKGRKYINVDLGENYNRSGRYMVDRETKEIYGISAYGKVNKNHHYGTLDTINNYYWGMFAPAKLKQPRDLKGIEFLTVEKAVASMEIMEQKYNEKINYSNVIDFVNYKNKKMGVI